MSAEQDFREAFQRLCAGAPNLLPKGSEISQNNVAREAGRDPSALKKSRFPALVSEIQTWISTCGDSRTTLASQVAKDVRRRNRSLRETIATMKRERDLALSMLVEADTVILQLRSEVESLKRKLERAS